MPILYSLIIFLDSMTLIRGQLVPSSDYFFDFEKKACHYFFNIVPQWPDMNSQSLHMVRLAMNWYALKYRVTLQVYTGTYRVLKLRHTNGTLIPIYLVPRLKKVPVPEVVYRAVYDHKRHAGVAFVGVNNVYLRGNYRRLCEDVSSELPWMTDEIKQFVYACSLYNWFRVLPHSFLNVKCQLLGTKLDFPPVSEEAKSKNASDKEA